MVKEKEDKWHEDFFMAFIYFVIAITIIFKGFSKIANSFIIDGKIKGGATKEKGLIAFVSLLENSWWKYIIILLLIFLMYIFIKSGLKKYKAKK